MWYGLGERTLKRLNKRTILFLYFNPCRLFLSSAYVLYEAYITNNMNSDQTAPISHISYSLTN